MNVKVRKTFSLDADLLAMLDGDDVESMSAQMNAILRQEYDRRQYQAGLATTDAALTHLFGEPDADLVDEFVAALS